MLNTGRQIGDFHCNFSCQKFFLLSMATKNNGTLQAEATFSRYELACEK